jgi:hypothetical protein
MTRHIHADLLHALAEDASLKIEYSDGFEWRIIENPLFDSTVQYRIHDPYRKFKGAIAAGKTVQVLLHNGKWENYDGNYDCAFNGVIRVSDFRIKPEPVVYVLEQAVYYKQRGSFVRCTYHDDVLVSCEVVK